MRIRRRSTLSPPLIPSSTAVRRSFVRSMLCALLAVTTLHLPTTLASATDDDSEDDIRWKYSLGFDYSRGDYGIERDTEIVYMPLSIEASGPTSRFKLTLPFLNVDGPSAIAIDGDGRETVETDSLGGFGQMSARMGWFLRPFHRNVPWFEFSTRVSAPTESDDSLGSGEWAFSLQVDAFKRIRAVSPFARFGRKFYVDRLNDRFYSSIGSSYRVTDSISLGASYDWSQASSSGTDDGHDIVGFASVRLDSVWSLGPYALAGLTDGSPNYGVGMTISFRPGIR